MAHLDIHSRGSRILITKNRLLNACVVETLVGVTNAGTPLICTHHFASCDQGEYAAMTVPVDERDWDEAPSAVGERLK